MGSNPIQHSDGSFCWFATLSGFAPASFLAHSRFAFYLIDYLARAYPLSNDSLIKPTSKCILPRKYVMQSRFLFTAPLIYSTSSHEKNPCTVCPTQLLEPSSFSFFGHFFLYTLISFK